MQFPLLGQDIEISEGRKNYMQILNYFRSMAEQAERDFRQEYENVFGNVFLNSTYAERFEKTYGKPGYMDEIVKKYVAKARLYLENYGVTSLSETTMWKEAVIAQDRGVSRLQYEFNVFEDSILFGEYEFDDKTYISKLKQKFGTNAFETCLYNDVMALCDYVLTFLYEKKFLPIQFVYKTEVSKADDIYNNLMCSNTPGADQEKQVCALIELDPRNRAYFEYIFCKYPKAKFEIAAIAKYLNVDISKLIEQDICNIFDIRQITCENEALKMKSDFQTYLQKMGLAQHALLNDLETILREYDIIARTYDGVLYDTRELRATAEEDDKYFCNLCGDVCNLTKEQCTTLISTIAAEVRTQQIKAKHTKVLKDRIILIQTEELESLLLGLESKTEGECNALKNAVENYDAPNELKVPFSKRIDDRIAAIWDAEDFERFSELFKQTPVEDESAIAQNCALVKREGRTETKELFVKAFYFLNENEVAAAAKYALAKEGGMLSSLLNMGKKESYQILTLGGRVMHPAIEAAKQVQKEAKGMGLLGGLGKLKNSFGFGKATTSPNKACPSCGKAIAQDVNFCPNCGNKID